MQFRLLVGNIPGFVYKGFRDWSVEFLDNRIASLTGYTKEAFDARKIRWSDLVVQEDIESSRESFIQALKHDRSFSREYRIRNRSGDIRWIQDRGYIKIDRKEEIEYISGIFFDITDRKQVETELHTAKAEAEALFQIVEKLLFGLREKKEEAALPLTEEEPPSVEDIFDLSKALDVVAGQKELFQEIAHLFLENLPVHLNQIQEGIAKGDARALEHAAHSLKKAP